MNKTARTAISCRFSLFLRKSAVQARRLSLCPALLHFAKRRRPHEQRFGTPARRAAFGFAECGRRRLSPPPLRCCPLRGQQRRRAHGEIVAPPRRNRRGGRGFRFAKRNERAARRSRAAAVSRLRRLTVRARALSHFAEPRRRKFSYTVSPSPLCTAPAKRSADC